MRYQSEILLIISLFLLSGSLCMNLCEVCPGGHIGTGKQTTHQSNYCSIK